MRKRYRAGSGGRVDRRRRWWWLFREWVKLILWMVWTLPLWYRRTGIAATETKTAAYKEFAEAMSTCPDMI